jgi:hypothetical protein
MVKKYSISTYTFENNCLKTSNEETLITYYYTDETTYNSYRK